MIDGAHCSQLQARSDSDLDGSKRKVQIWGSDCLIKIKLQPRYGMWGNVFSRSTICNIQHPRQESIWAHSGPQAEKIKWRWECPRAWCPEMYLPLSPASLSNLSAQWAARKASLNRNTHDKIMCWFSSIQSLSRVRLFVTPWNYSMPGFPVHHQLPGITQTHVHWVGDAVQPSHLLLSPSPPIFSLSKHQGLFKWVSSSHELAKVLEFQLQHQSFQWILRTDIL